MILPPCGIKTGFYRIFDYILIFFRTWRTEKMVFLFQSQKEYRYETILDFNEGWRSRNQFSGRKPCYHFWCLLESSPRRSINLQSLSFRPRKTSLHLQVSFWPQALLKRFMKIRDPFNLKVIFLAQEYLGIQTGF